MAPPPVSSPATNSTCRLVSSLNIHNLSLSLSHYELLLKQYLGLTSEKKDYIDD